ncbi:DNA-directed RNA polymerase [Candidatus Micrarchaeota archaeon]|nr:DNA-directed RNA polymerase [Candidatus Micrarchaeota archaeon]
MYQLTTFHQSVRVPPNLFGLKLEEAALKILREQKERTIDKENGVIITIQNVEVKSSGKVLQGDGAAYFDVNYEALVFKPIVNEIVSGDVSEIVEFGAFVRMGPIDGLVHVSQVANDFFSFDKKTGNLVGRESKKSLKKGDVVKAKVATVSLKDTVANSKIALTMRPLAKQSAGKKTERKKKA